MSFQLRLDVSEAARVVTSHLLGHLRPELVAQLVEPGQPALKSASLLEQFADRFGYHVSLVHQALGDDVLSLRASNPTP